MSSQPFVGRQDEIAQFEQVLADPAGQAILVAGQAGMGKTWLVNKLTEIAENHPQLECRTTRFEVTPDDAVTATLELILEYAKDAAEAEAGFLEVTDQGRKQLRALLGLVPKGDKLAELVSVLRREVKGHLRVQFLDVLRALSQRIPDNSRAIFIIDPEKLMHSDSADTWRLITRDLPPKILFIFAQRLSDALISNRAYTALPNVHRIPPATDGLYTLDDQAVQEMIDHLAPQLPVSIGEVRTAVARYHGHPYAVGAALDLIVARRPLDQLPADPTGSRIAETQWEHLRKQHGEQAIRLFEAFAVLQEAVPMEVADAVAEVDRLVRTQLLADRFLNSLLREETEGRRIYHAILADHIREQLEQDNGAQPYHQRAIALFRERLRESRENQTAPDPIAAKRLAVHVRHVEGFEEYVLAYVNECADPLMSLGLYEAAIEMSRDILSQAQPGSVEEAAVAGNLGVIYRTRGDLEQAEAMHRKSLEIEQKLGRLEGMASDYGNLGLIYKTRGDLEQAEAMHRKSLEISEKLGQLEGMAIQYGNLGLIYRTRGDLDHAEAMHRKSLEIEQKLGQLEGMARDYGNLGNVMQTRGDLDGAEAMYRKALKIEEKLGRLEGMARAYGNLGLIYMTRGDLDQAEAMHRKALEINEKLGRLEGMANQYCNLGLIYKSRGDLDHAEAMQRKSLEIEQKLGRLEGMARDYGNLGALYVERGDLPAAREHWLKARDLFTRAQMPQMAEKTQRLLDGLPQAGRASG